MTDQPVTLTDETTSPAESAPLVLASIISGALALVFAVLTINGVYLGVFAIVLGLVATVTGAVGAYRLARGVDLLVRSR